MADMTDRAIDWVRQQRLLAGSKPFFMYFAPGATHAPHHVPKEWADKYKGEFDQGWDRLREGTFARQKSLGVIPRECELTNRPSEIPAWDTESAELKPVLARQMEVYAGFFEFTDHHIGRLINALEQLQVLDDTLIYYIIGDNGASGEGTLQGTFNEMLSLNGLSAFETAAFLSVRIDKFGSPESYNHYAVGWAHAMDAPYQWTKQIASHWGGTRNGTIIHWPKGIKAKGEARHQFHHVIDIAPTILETAQLPEPYMVNGVAQVPMQGVICSTVLTMRGQRNGARPSTSRCSAIAASTTKDGPRSHVTRRPGCSSVRKRLRLTTTCGNSTTRTPTGVRRTISRRRILKSSTSCSDSG